jgi:hypothetical protein
MTEKIMQVVHFNEEGIRMCIIEKFYMDKKTTGGYQLYDKHTVQPSRILRPSYDVKVM